MAVNLQTVRTYFKALGLASEIADIYFALHSYGPLSISELARYSGVERTRIYRLMNELQGSQLIEVEVHYKRSIFRAASFSNLQVLIAKKEQEVKDLQTSYYHLNEMLSHRDLVSAATRVQFYQGDDGLKQMYWNQVRGKTDNLAILYENMQTNTNSAFFERWVRRCNERNNKFRGIIGDHFIASQRKWYKEHSNERLANWEARYVADDVFPITCSVTIYDDVTAYFNRKDGEIFGIEIYNQQIADAQRRFFEMLWDKSLPVDDLTGPSKRS